MRSRISALVAAFVAAAVLGAPLAGAATELTATTWDEALALSRQHQKPILIDFFTEW